MAIGTIKLMNQIAKRSMALPKNAEVLDLDHLVDIVDHQANSTRREYARPDSHRARSSAGGERVQDYRSGPDLCAGVKSAGSAERN